MIISEFCLCIYNNIVCDLKVVHEEVADEGLDGGFDRAVVKISNALWRVRVPFYLFVRDKKGGD